MLPKRRGSFNEARTPDNNASMLSVQDSKPDLEFERPPPVKMEVFRASDMPKKGTDLFGESETSLASLAVSNASDSDAPSQGGGSMDDVMEIAIPVPTLQRSTANIMPMIKVKMVS